jgi:FkbM family methyltransferase
VIKSKYITSIFQKLFNNRDIRSFKNKFFYYVIFRLIRNFLKNDLIIQIYNFKVFGSIKKNKTSYFLLKKCDFGDHHELNTIKNFSIKNKILFLDCGSNYGFYSFYTSALAKENLIISIEASKTTSEEFLKNLQLNNFRNIEFHNKAISDNDNITISFNESENDWESSQSHSDFKINTISNIKSVKIDTLVKTHDNLNDYKTIIKLDIEGNEMNAIQGGLKFIEKTSPIIIIEFSQYIFGIKSKVEYLKSFLLNFDYSIYSTDKEKISLNEVIMKLNQLNKKYKTIGNYYLIRNSSNNLKIFLSND